MRFFFLVWDLKWSHSNGNGNTSGNTQMTHMTSYSLTSIKQEKNTMNVEKHQSIYAFIFQALCMLINKTLTNLWLLQNVLCWGRVTGTRTRVHLVGTQTNVPYWYKSPDLNSVGAHKHASRYRWATGLQNLTTITYSLFTLTFST